MSAEELISPEIKRFILTSIESIPYLEAILLLRANPAIEWDAKMMAQRLYINEKKAGEILANLCIAGFAAFKEDIHLYIYKPVSRELQEKMDRLAEIYAKNLIEVTHLIHAKIDKQAQEFGDAFKWQNKKD